MALTETDKTDIRFFCGYAFHGDNPTNMDNIYAHTNNWYLENRLGHLSATEETKVLELLVRIRTMQTEIDAARDNMDLLEAGSFIQNPDEVPNRIRLFNRERRRLARWFNVDLGDGGGGLNLIV